MARSIASKILTASTSESAGSNTTGIVHSAATDTAPPTCATASSKSCRWDRFFGRRCI